MRHLIIPDTQITPGTPMDHLSWDRMRKILFALPLLLLTACLPYGSQDTTWEDMTPWSMGPRCDTQIEVYYHDGDFNVGQVGDIAAAFSEIQAWSAIPMRFMGPTWWQTENEPMYTVTIENRPPPGGSAYGNVIAYDRQHYHAKGTVQLGSYVMGLPTGRTGYNTGDTFRGRVEHEMIHAIAGLGDLYDNDDGHPSLLMGNGYKQHSQAALGDIIGMIYKGCRSNADKWTAIQEVTK